MVEKTSVLHKNETIQLTEKREARKKKLPTEISARWTSTHNQFALANVHKMHKPTNWPDRKAQRMQYIEAMEAT